MCVWGGGGETTVLTVVVVVVVTGGGGGVRLPAATLHTFIPGNPPDGVRVRHQQRAVAVRHPVLLQAERVERNARALGLNALLREARKGIGGRSGGGERGNGGLEGLGETTYAQQSSRKRLETHEVRVRVKLAVQGNMWRTGGAAWGQRYPRHATAPLDKRPAESASPYC